MRIRPKHKLSSFISFIQDNYSNSRIKLCSTISTLPSVTDVKRKWQNGFFAKFYNHVVPFFYLQHITSANQWSEKRERKRMRDRVKERREKKDVVKLRKYKDEI